MTTFQNTNMACCQAPDYSKTTTVTITGGPYYEDPVWIMAPRGELKSGDRVVLSRDENGYKTYGTVV